MERYCTFCQKLYPYKKDISSQTNFVKEMFISANMSYFRRDDNYHDGNAKLLFIGETKGSPRPISSDIKSTAPKNFNIHNVRSFFFNHIKDSCINEILDAFGISSSAERNFNALTYALAKEFILYCQHDENDEHESVAQLYEYYLNNPSFVDDREIKEKRPTYEKLLLTQVGSICPLCNKTPLYIKKGAETHQNFLIVPIFPSTSSTYEKSEMIKIISEPRDKYSLNNTIPLCCSCGMHYQNSDADAKIKIFKDLIDIKKSIQKKQNEIGLLNSLELSQKLTQIINKLKEKRINIINNLNIREINDDIITFEDGSTIVLKEKIVYNPSTIQNKIKDDEDLINITRTYVLTNYKKIKAHLLLLDDEEIGFFDDLKEQVNKAYQIIKMSNNDKRMIINKLSDWIINQLFNRSEADKYSFEGTILVSFFIQNCEVFEA